METPGINELVELGLLTSKEELLKLPATEAAKRLADEFMPIFAGLLLESLQTAARSHEPDDPRLAELAATITQGAALYGRILSVIYKSRLDRIRTECRVPEALASPEAMIEAYGRIRKLAGAVDDDLKWVRPKLSEED